MCPVSRRGSQTHKRDTVNLDISTVIHFRESEKIDVWNFIHVFILLALCFMFIKSICQYCFRQSFMSPFLVRVQTCKCAKKVEALRIAAVKGFSN